MKERRCTKGVKSEIGTKSRCKESWKRSQSMTSPPDLCVHACCEKTQKVHFSVRVGGGVSLHLPSKNSEFFFARYQDQIFKSERRCSKLFVNSRHRKKVSFKIRCAASRMMCNSRASKTLFTVRRPKASRSTGHSTYWSRDRFRRGAGCQAVLRRDRFHMTRAHERRDRFHPYH